MGASDDNPTVLVIVHGYDFATLRTPAFLKTALSSRRSPINLCILCDHGGCRGFRDAWRTHVLAEGLSLPGDSILFLEEEEAAAEDDLEPGHLEEETRRPLPEAAIEFLASIHPLCGRRGYLYLFYKFLAPELLPDAEKLIVLDPDALVLGDLADLWKEFDHFDERHVISMAVDQSDRYYYRLQNATDPGYSAGWVGVAHGVGVNGGVLLLHAARARALGFAKAIAALTHVGMREREQGHLSFFCDLAEQDTVNLAILRFPYIWRPLDCAWNYMSTGLGGHRLADDASGLALSYYDTCAPNGVTGSGGVKPGDLFKCSCGRQIGILHFAGAVRGRPLLAKLNASILANSGPQLRLLARHRAARPRWLDAAAAAPTTMSSRKEEL